MKLKFTLFLFALALTFPVMALGETKEVRLGEAVFLGGNLIGTNHTTIVVTGCHVDETVHIMRFYRLSSGLFSSHDLSDPVRVAKNDTFMFLDFTKGERNVFVKILDIKIEENGCTVKVKFL
ncbi:MAG: hypothetical protein R3B60_01395 [Candidatus Paceibacterota bacterium]